MWTRQVGEVGVRCVRDSGGLPGITATRSPRSVSSQEETVGHWAVEPMMGADVPVRSWLF